MSEGPFTPERHADLLANRMPRAQVIEFAQHELETAEAVLAMPETQDILRELARAAAAAFVLRRMRGLPGLSIEQQLLQSAEFFGCGVTRVCALAALMTTRGGMSAPLPADKVDESLN